MVAVNNIMITWHESGVRTIEDAKKTRDRDRRHRRELAVGALSDRRQQPVRHAIQDRVGLSRRRRHHDRAGAARGGRTRQRLLGVAEVQQPRLDPRPQGQHPVPGRPAARGRSARSAALDRTRAERGAAADPRGRSPAMPRLGVRSSPRRMCRPTACARCARRSTTRCAIRRSARPPRRPTCISIRSAARSCSRS